MQLDTQVIRCLLRDKYAREEPIKIENFVKDTNVIHNNNNLISSECYLHSLMLYFIT